MAERKMKDSGIEWIGEIPENWKCCKQKYEVQLINGRAYSDDEFEDDGKYRVLRVGNLFSNPVWYTSSLELAADKYCEKGDLLYAWSMSYAPVIWEGERVIFHYHIWKAKLTQDVDKKFVYYYFMALTDALKSEIHETTMGFITMGVMNNSHLAFPDIAEQESIADFLDSKCSQIDHIAENIQKEIDKLEEYKRSVITEAVTKGLNPDVEMKDSGVEWVGMIPAHWKIHPVYSCFGERKNVNKLGIEKNLLSLSYGRIIRKDINSKGGLLPASFNTYNIVEPGDIIIRPTDLQNDKRSLRTGLVEEHGIITSAYIDLMPIGDVDTEYYHYLLHSYDVMKVFYNMGNGVRQSLNFSEFSKLMIFEPPISEQHQIVKHLNQKCEQINSVIQKKKEQLSKLDSYKKSLIYEYVTGKKEVPEVTA